MLASGEKIDIARNGVLIEELKVENRLTSNQDIADTSTLFVLADLTLQIRKARNGCMRIALKSSLKIAVAHRIVDHVALDIAEAENILNNLRYRKAIRLPVAGAAIHGRNCVERGEREPQSGIPNRGVRQAVVLRCAGSKLPVEVNGDCWQTLPGAFAKQTGYGPRLPLPGDPNDEEVGTPFHGRFPVDHLIIKRDAQRN